jgi:hypothetical protein
MLRLRIMFEHLSIQLMGVFFVAGVCVALYAAPLWMWLLVPLGIGAQMLNEYSLHRFIFHLPPPHEQWKFDLLYRAHYGHHDFPTNHGLFFVPIWVALPMLVINICVVWGLLSLIAPGYALIMTVMIVLIGGIGTFMGYEWFHMTAHLNLPKTWVERHVSTLHNQHHFRDFSKWFHVSPGGHVIDRVMGTAIDRDSLKSQQRIEFIRTLGMRPDDERLVAAREKFAAKYALSQDEVLRVGKA